MMKVLHALKNASHNAHISLKVAVDLYIGTWHLRYITDAVSQAIHMVVRAYGKPLVCYICCLFSDFLFHCFAGFLLLAHTVHCLAACVPKVCWWQQTSGGILGATTGTMQLVRLQILWGEFV